MKRKLLLALGLLLSASFVKGQWANNFTWNYNFGTGTGTFNTIGTNSSTTPTVSGFLPTPQSGTVGVYINGSASGGSFTLNGDNTMTQKLPADKMVRFSVNSVASSTDVVVNTFKIKFSPAISTTDAGNYVYAIGNHKGNLFNPTSNNSVYRASNELFTALRWTPATAANSTTIKFEYRLGSDASSTTTWTEINSTTFAKGQEYDVAIYCNNSATDQTYTVATIPFTLSSNKFHVWVNGVRLNADYPRSIEVNGTTGLTSGTSIAIPNGTALNAFLFNATGASGATGSIILTNPKLVYSVPPLPVSLTSFTGESTNSGVLLNWKTASEQNNSHFEISRAGEDKNFKFLSRINSKGNSDVLQNYNFNDNNPLNGNNYYQLKQVDFDGTETVFNQLVAVKSSLNNQSFKVSVTDEGLLNAHIYAASSASGKIAIYDMNGRKVFEEQVSLQEGQNVFNKTIPAIQTGVYVARVLANGLNAETKFVKK